MSLFKSFPVYHDKKIIFIGRLCIRSKWKETQEGSNEKLQAYSTLDPIQCSFWKDSLAFFVVCLFTNINWYDKSPSDLAWSIRNEGGRSHLVNFGSNDVESLRLSKNLDDFVIKIKVGKWKEL